MRRCDDPDGLDGGGYLSGDGSFGLTLHEAMTCLAVFARSGSRLAALVITEVNPDQPPTAPC